MVPEDWDIIFYAQNKIEDYQIQMYIWRMNKYKYSDIVI